MEVYSKGSTPRLEAPSGNCYYEGASAFKAADISSVESSVKEALNSLKAEVEESVPKFNKLVEEMDINFGEKFIKLNDQKLGFVDVEAFNTLSKDLSTSMETSSSNADTFFSTCSSSYFPILMK